jgi:hypothetical protein
MGNPFPLKQNAKKSFQGSIVLGKGFVLTPKEAEKLIAKDPRNKDVLFPYLNGDDLNNDPEQKPSRWVINFFDWSEEKARTYPDCFEIIERLVKPERQRWAIDKYGNEIVGTYALRKPLPQKWWIYGEKRPALYETISKLDHVMVSCRVSKYVNQSFILKDLIFDVATSVVVRKNIWEYAFLQSTLHEQWAWKYASTLESRIRYLNVDCIDTFPVPTNLSNLDEQRLNEIGEQYHTFRRKLMFTAKIGLTKMYNLFHDKRIILLPKMEELLDDKTHEKKYGREAVLLKKHLNNTSETCKYNEVVNGILKLRELHIQMDIFALEAYGWNDIKMRHDFYDVEYLSENDRIRFTINPEARKEILKRLLLLNHEQHNQEQTNTDLKIKKPTKKSKKNELANKLFTDLE